jgi:membrane associated rhomboid family serine protease
VTTRLSTCYRHPDRETGVSCQRCERPICPNCMVPAPVGFQCVECVRRLRPPVPVERRLQEAAGWLTVTNLLIAVNVGVWLFGAALGGGLGLFSGSPLAPLGGLAAAPVATGEWWRIFTAGFLHSGLLHVGFNMAVLYMLGPQLERVLGRLRFSLLYGASLVAGSLGALLASPDALTVGASGAIFGLMAATIVGQRAAGIDPRASGMVTWLVVNLLFTFLVPGISIGGHLGGLAGGFVAGLVVFHRRLHPLVGALFSLALAGGCFEACLWVASHPVGR